MIRRLVTSITFSLVAALPALAIEGAREVFPAPGPQAGRLVIHGATDLETMRPL